MSQDRPDLATRPEPLAAPLAYRAASEGDRAFCWQLHGTLRPYVEATWGWDNDDQRRRFDAWFDAAPLQIVESGGRSIGMLRVDRGATPVRLLSIAIAPAEQRRGFGRAVIADVLSEAAPRAVWLQVLKANPARALYERLGFVVTGGSDTHWHMLRTP